MPPYLYALIGALIFAIVHGMHFTVGMLPDETPGTATQLAHIQTAAPGRPQHDVQIAGLGY